MHIEETIIKDQIPKLRRHYYEPGYRALASDEEILGIAIAHIMQWDGVRIMDVAARALEDANFHDASGQVLAMKDAFLEDDTNPF